MKRLLKRLPLGRLLRGIRLAFCRESTRQGRSEPQLDQAAHRRASGSGCAPVPHPKVEVVVRTVRDTAARGCFHLVFSRDRQVGVVFGEVAVGDTADPRITEEVRRSVMSLLEIGSMERLFSELIHHLPRQRAQLLVRLLGVVAEPDTGQVHIYNAGHAPVLLFTGDDQDYAVATAPPLGMVENAHVTPQTYAFRAYDTLFITSNGFFKLRTPDGEILTLDDLETMVHQAATDTLNVWVEGIIAATGAFTPVSDDLTLVAVRMRPEKSRAAPLLRLPNRASEP